MKKWVPLTTIKMVQGALKRGGRLKSPHRDQDRDLERDWKKWVSIYYAELFILHGIKQGQGLGMGMGNLAMGSIPIFPVPIPVLPFPVLVPVPCSVNAP